MRRWKIQFFSSLLIDLHTWILTECTETTYRCINAPSISILTIEASWEREIRRYSGEESETRLLLSTKLIMLFGNKLQRKARCFHALRRAADALPLRAAPRLRNKIYYKIAEVCAAYFPALTNWLIAWGLRTVSCRKIVHRVKSTNVITHTSARACVPSHQSASNGNITYSWYTRVSCFSVWCLVIFIYLGWLNRPHVELRADVASYRMRVYSKHVGVKCHRLNAVNIASDISVNSSLFVFQFLRDVRSYLLNVSLRPDAGEKEAGRTRMIREYSARLGRKLYLHEPVLPPALRPEW